MGGRIAGVIQQKSLGIPVEVKYMKCLIALFLLMVHASLKTFLAPFLGARPVQ